VSPPKLTRRPKRDSPSETGEVKKNPSRESQLQSRNGNPDKIPLDSRKNCVLDPLRSPTERDQRTTGLHNNLENKKCEQKTTVIENSVSQIPVVLQQTSDGGVNEAKPLNVKALIEPQGIPASSTITSFPSKVPGSSMITTLPSRVPGSSTITSLPSRVPGPSTVTNLPSRVPGSSTITIPTQVEQTTKGTDYVTWDDMQTRQLSRDGETEALSSLSPPDNPMVGSSVCPTQVDDGRKTWSTGGNGSGDAITLVKDGDSSVLKFSFTVRLKNEMIQNACIVADNQGDVERPFVSGTINVRKSNGTVSTGEVSIQHSKGVNLRQFDACRVNKTEMQRLRLADDLVSGAENINTIPLPPRHRGDEADGNGERRTIRQSAASSADRIRSTGTASENFYSPTTKRVVRDSIQRASVTRSPCHQAMIATVHKAAVKYDHSYKDGSDKTNEKTKSKLCRVETIENCPTLALRINDRSMDNQSKLWETDDLGDVVDRCGGFNETEELTHMSWEEVMKEAKMLGIPLNRRAPAGNDTKERPRRSSASSLMENIPILPTSAETKTTFWVCPSCLSDTSDAAVPIHPTGARGGDKLAASTAVSSGTATTSRGKWGSPFRDRFQNFFGCRKQKTEDVKSKEVAASTTRSSALNSKQQKQNHQKIKISNTLPSLSSPRLAVARVQDSSCLNSSTIGGRNEKSCTAVTSRFNTMRAHKDKRCSVTVKAQISPEHNGGSSNSPSKHRARSGKLLSLCFNN